MKLKLLTPLALLALFTLTGCSENGQALVNAVQKTAGADYYESETTVSFAMDYSGGDAYFNEQARVSKQMLNNLTLTANSAVEQDMAAGTAKAAGGMAWVLDPVTVEADYWRDVDLDAQKYDVILRIPEAVKAFIPETDAKDYAYVNLFEALAAAMGTETFDMAALLPASGAEGYAGMAEVAAIYGNIDDYVTVSDGLTLTMTPKQLIALLTAYQTAIDDESMANTYAGIPEAGLSGEGLSFVPQINKDGYMESYDMTLHLIMDLAILDDNEGYGVVDFTMRAESQFTNINQSGEVTVPALSEGNAANLTTGINGSAVIYGY